VNVRLIHILTTCAAVASAGGCWGNIGDGGGGRPSSDDTRKPGESALAPLIRIEYEATVAAAFPDVALPAVDLPTDGSDGIFTTNTSSRLVEFSPYVTAAETLGTAIAASLAGRCDWATTPGPCAEQELRAPLRILYRRQVTDDDVGRLADLFTRARANTPSLSVDEGLASVIAATLLAPSFLFRTEWDGVQLPDGRRELTAYELAARLSYFLTDGPPDTTLLTAATTGQLATPELVVEQALRLFESGGAEAVTRRFVREWTAMSGLDRRSLSNGLTAELREAFNDEFERFTLGIIRDDDAPFDAFFNGNYSYLNATLAEHYGVDAGQLGDELQRVEWPASSGRRGVMTQGALLAATAVPDSASKTILGRGRVVFTRFFCGNLPPPDPAFLAEPVEDRLADSRCAGCHKMMDPIGKGLSQYDHLGRFDPAKVVPGAISATDTDGEFVGAEALGDRLAASDMAKQCYASLWFRYALERKPGATGDDPTIRAMHDVIAKGGTTRDLLRVLISSEPFRTVNDPLPRDPTPECAL
jgi:hypothetical protein